MEYMKFNADKSADTMRGYYNDAKVDEILNIIIKNMIIELEISSKKGNRFGTLQIENLALTDKEKDILKDHFGELGYNYVSIKENSLETVVTVGFEQKEEFY